MALSLTDVQDFLKEWYHGQQVHNVVFKNKPFLDSLRRNPNAGGEYDPIPVMTSGVQGIGGVYTTAQTNASNAPGTAQFALTFGQYFTIVQLEEKLVRGGVKNEHAFLNNVKKKTDEALDHTGLDLSVQAIGNGGAPIGVALTVTASTNTVVLSNKDDIVNFWTGMKIVASDDDGSDSSHTLRDSGAAVTITGVNHNAGSFTYSGTDISGFTVGDYIFREGSFAGNVSQTTLMKGLEAWNPYTAPGSSDSFYGVNRNTKGDLTYGFSSTGLTDVERGNVVERLEVGATFMHSRFGSTPDSVWLHNRQFRKASITLQNKGYRMLDVKNATGTFGYKGIAFTSDWGECMVRPDRHFSTSYARFTNSDHIELRSIGDVMSTMDADGLTVRKIPNAAGWQWDWVTFANIAIDKPCEFGVVALPAL